MEILGGVLILLGVTSVVYLLESSWKKAGRARTRRLAAEASGLTEREESTAPVLGWGKGLAGTYGPLRVRLEESYGHGLHVGTRILIDGLGHGPMGLTLMREQTFTAIVDKAVRAEIELGDEAFDSYVYVRGSPAIVRAIFDAETRQHVSRLLEGRIDVADAPGVVLEAEVVVLDGEIHVDLGHGAFGGVHVPGALRTVLEVAQRLVRPDDIPRRLAKNARTDPLAGVRLQNLLTLVREYPNDPATREALLAAREDESEEIRLRAGMALGDEGRAVLLEIASTERKAKRRPSDSPAAQAIAALGEHLPRERALDILDRALRTGRVEVAQACLGALGRIGGSEVVEPLAKVVTGPDSELAVTAAKALGATGMATAENPLIEALGRESPELRVAAAEALGRVGTVGAVLPLKEAEAPDRTLRHAARQAIAAIQSRLTGASPGQLSLAEGEAGRLSLAEDESGRVSLVQGDTPPLVNFPEDADRGKE